MVIGGVVKPWPVRKVRAHRVCWRPLARATGSASHDDVVLILCVVDLVQRAPVPRVQKTLVWDFMSVCVAKEASIVMVLP